MNVVRANYGFELKEVLKHFMHFLVLCAVILLCSRFGRPKADCKDTIGLFVGDENGLIHETFLFLQDLSLMVSESSRFLPGLVVNSTIRVNIHALLSG